MIELDKLTILVPPSVTGFSVTCPFCVQRGLDAYLNARVEGELPVDDERGLAVCPNGHQLGIERAA